MSLTESRIRAALSSETGGPWTAPIVAHAETGSTSDDAKALAREGCAEGTLVVADAQTKGRGRSGAGWHSPPRENAYLSLVLRPALTPRAVAPLTLVVGLVVRDVVGARVEAPVRVKWPNDVFVRDRKLAGILVEGQIRGDALASVVIGVGVNVATRSFPPPLDEIATSLAIEEARDLDRASLVAEIVVGIRTSTERFVRDGLAAFADRVAAHDVLRGREIAVGGVRGTARGIDALGRLLVERADGSVEAIVSGHVDLAPGPCRGGT